MGEVRAKRKYRVTQLIENSGAGGMGKKTDQGVGLLGDGDLAKSHKGCFGGDGNVYILWLQ